MWHGLSKLFVNSENCGLIIYARSIQPHEWCKTIAIGDFFYLFGREEKTKIKGNKKKDLAFVLNPNWVIF